MVAPEEQGELLVTLRVLAMPARLALIRRLVSEVVTAAGGGAACVRDIRLAVDEACQNVIRHAYQEGQHHGIPYVRDDWVAKCADGLIALSAAREGDIGQALLNNHPNRALQLAKHWKQHFPDEQLLILKSEDYFEDPVRQVMTAYEFLGLPSYTPPKLEPPPVFPFERLTKKTREQIDRVFRRSTEDLKQLLHWDTAWESDSGKVLY